MHSQKSINVKKLQKRCMYKRILFFIIRISRKKFPSSGTFYQKFILISSFDNFPVSTQTFRVKVKRLAGGENEGVTVEQCCWCLEKKRWKESSSRKVEDNSSDWEGVTPFTIALLEFDCFSFALFPQGTRVAEANWTLAKATKPITSALYSRYSVNEKRKNYG